MVTARRPGASNSIRTLGWITVIAVLALMTLGNIVSATGSGLACPDWPLCHGRLVPPLHADVLVEYGHRLAAVAASLLLVLTSVLTMRRPESLGARRLAILLLALLGIQVGLGGVTVLLKLPHLISTAHLVNALLILAGAILLSEAGAGPPRAPSEKLARPVRIGLVVLLFQLALGGYVRHSGAGLACPDFPLCGGELLPGHWLGVAHWIHRWLGVALLGLFVHLALAARHSQLAIPVRIVGLLVVLQVALGITAVVLRLDPPTRAAHAAVGYALWGLLIWISVRVGCWDRALADAPRNRDTWAGAVHVS